MQYRKDIDGLRAFAVLPVIFFHAGIDFFKGGFLGVDIFFVISGFLITTILLGELEQNKFSIVNFYERRARRILPALFIVLITTYVAGVILMPALEFKEFSQSLVSVVAFVSNLFFFLEIDYFSLAAEEMPLLHTWSLAIEEQYYIFFPPLLYLIWVKSKRLLPIILWIMTLASIVAVMIHNHLGQESANFYSPISRAWELMAGSISAYVAHKGMIRVGNKFVADLAFALLLLCLIVWPDNVYHPGLLTILPVVATCAVILYCSPASISYKILSNSFFVFVGLISYSLYLWHQPILALLRLKTVGHPSMVLFALAIGLTFLLAYLSYKYVETPFRNKKRYGRKFIFGYSFVGLACFGLLGITGHFKDGFSSRFDNISQLQASMKSSPKRKTCHSSSTNYIQPSDACEYFGSMVKWASFGDSHTVEPAYALASSLASDDIGLSHHSFSGCPPVFGYTVKGQEVCISWINDTLTHLENDKNISTVLVGFRYTYHLFGDNTELYPSVPSLPSIDIVSDKNLSHQEKIEMYWEGIEHVVKRLLDAEKKVILLEPVPELPIHISKAVTPWSIFSDKTMLDIDTSTSKNYFEERHKVVLDKLESLTPHENLIRLSVYDALCNELGCPAAKNGRALYFDDDHLSVYGSELLIDALNSKLADKR